MSYGTVSHFENSATVRFEREIAAPVNAVWEALTNTEELAGWLAPCTFDARSGGAVHFDFGDDQVVDGQVTIFDPPHRLEYTWTFTDEPDSILLFELEAVGSATRLVLEHRMLPSEQATGYGAGWHAYLDRLAARVEGTEPVDWDERFSEVLGSYAGA